MSKYKGEEMSEVFWVFMGYLAVFFACGVMVGYHYGYYNSRK